VLVRDFGQRIESGSSTAREDDSFHRSLASSSSAAFSGHRTTVRKSADTRLSISDATTLH
jgi:hypothetical protein